MIYKFKVIFLINKTGAYNVRRDTLKFYLNYNSGIDSMCSRVIYTRSLLVGSINIVQEH